MTTKISSYVSTWNNYWMKIENEDLVEMTFIDKEFLNWLYGRRKISFLFFGGSFLCEEMHVFGSMIHNNYDLDRIPTILGVSNNFFDNNDESTTKQFIEDTFHRHHITKNTIGYDWSYRWLFLWARRSIQVHKLVWKDTNWFWQNNSRVLRILEKANNHPSENLVFKNKWIGRRNFKLR